MKIQGLRVVLITVLVSQVIFAGETYHQQRVSLFESLPLDTTSIVFIGNSITDGGNWAELFNDLRVKNRGISSDVTAGVMARLDSILAAAPDKIFLMIGINDLSRDVELTEIVANYESIIKRVKEETPTTRLYLQSVLPVNPSFGYFPDHTNKTREVSQLNWHLRRLARLHGAIYVDLWSNFLDVEGYLDSTYTNDGLHLTGAGYLLWRDTIREQVFE